MTRETFGDRFLLISLAIFLLASLIFAYFLYEDSDIGLAFGQPLTDTQKARATDIALADPLVSNEVASLAWAANGINGTYYVRGVSGPLPFHEVGPGFDRTRRLPAVEIVIGNESEIGFNVMAYVDLSRGRVAGVRFPAHAVMEAGMYPISRPDITIIETGYHAGDALSGEELAKVVRIARENTTMQGMLQGNINYSVQEAGIWYASFFKDDNLYVGAYPTVRFTENTPMYEPDFLVDAVVDPGRGKVLQTQVHVRTPALVEPGTTP